MKYSKCFRRDNMMSQMMMCQMMANVMFLPAISYCHLGKLKSKITR